ncbi:type VI secretion system membrane subunit TssM [Aestuariispira ectoiniformans]|uniref:type VI secretion system membrane subunit TssM n=1 Tax=Aestuariispira ectoiniformans TaxID=2775080 RepID=UPI00223C22FD|nr:type VI secretion system membrane subunit TssM [Aestuariispira ectoiniformans]
MLIRILKFLKKILRPLPLIAVVSAILALMVYFFGEKIGARGVYPFANSDIRFWSALCFAAVAVLLGGFLLVQAIFTWLANRRKAADREPTVEELEASAMKMVFDRGLKVIRNRWSGDGKGLYGLPWYLVVGRAESGKSSLIENSDLRFPIDHEIDLELRDLADRKAAGFFRWRVAGNEAVLLDLNGEYFRVDKERTSVQNVLWDKFLSNLQRIRPRRPVNGVVLAIDFAEFLGMTEAERDEYSRQVRGIVNELVERLGTRMTIHLTFTKLDQVAGFKDFFATLSAADRDMLYGFHFLCEGHHTPEWLTQFETQYEEYLERLHLRLKKKMLELKSASSRQEAFSFYRVFLGLEEPLRSFLEAALSPDKFTTPPLVRGVYFLSNRQENAPRNAFLEAVGERYAIPDPLYGTSQGSSYPYFVNNFLKKVVFPEAGLAGDNQKAVERYCKQMAAAAVLVLVVCLGGGLYWNNRYEANLAYANDVLNKTRDFTGRGLRVTYDITGQRLLTPLNHIREAMSAFKDYRDTGPVAAQLSLYQGRRIGPLVDKAYRNILNTHFAPTIIKGLERDLRTVCPKGGDTELGYLRVYRMMADLKGRDNRAVERYFNAFWTDKVIGSRDKVAQLNSHLAYMLEESPQAYDVNPSVVLQAQRDLGKLTPFRRVYHSMRELTERQLPNPLEFSRSVGAAFDLVYQPSPTTEGTADTSGANGRGSGLDGCGVITERSFEGSPFRIPRFFTKAQFHDFFVPEIARVASIAADDLWVLGQLEDNQYSQADYEEIRSKVRDNYVEEYIGTWRQSLNMMKVQDFEDIRHATEVLHTLSGTNSPMRRVAELVSENTVIYMPEAKGAQGEGVNLTDVKLEPNREAGLRIAAAFALIQGMLNERPDGNPSNMDQIQEALKAVYDYMKSVRDAPDPNAKALELAIQRAQLAGEDPIFVLQRIADRAPAPFDRQLRHVASEAWRTIMAAATVELNRKWQNEVYGTYQRLIAGKYPFDRRSSQDLPLQDFKEFFRPGGILDSFYSQELLTFVDVKTGEPKVIDGQSLPVNRSFSRRLRHANNITKSFFDQTGELAVEFKVSPVGMSANLSRAVLNFEGQLIVSSHGPSRPITVFWPNIIDGPASSRVDLAPLAGKGHALSKQFDGSWSWLRLYDSASKANQSESTVDISFASSNGQSAIFRIRPEARVNVFFNSPISNFSLPSHL